MSTSERFQAEPPPPPAPGMSTGSKVLLGCGIGCGVLALLCCGGVLAIGWLGYDMFKHGVDQDPAHVRTMTEELASIDIPAGLQPKAAIDIRIPIVGQSLFKAAIYTDGQEGDDTQVFALGEVSGAVGTVDQNRLRDEIDRALSRQEARSDADDDFRPDEAEKHTLELEIRSKPAKFLIEVGELHKSHKKMIRAMGQFEGHNGTALLFLQLDAEQHDLDQVEQILRSIR